jgi:hypothetical protein
MGFPEETSQHDEAGFWLSNWVVGAALLVAIIGQPGVQCMPGSVSFGHGAAASTGMTPTVIASKTTTNLNKRLMQL